MADRHQILVIGATGTVGRDVVSELIDANVAVRGLVRDPESHTLPGGLEIARGDLSEPASLTAALDGVSAVFVVWPFTSPKAATQLAPAVIDVIAARTQRIVYLSAEAAATRPEAFWARLERLIAASSVEWTFLRPTGFAKNTLMWADQIRADGVVRWPYAAASRSLIHEADIAGVAVRALTEDGHAGKTYVLTGPAAITQSDQVLAIGEAISRPLRFEEVAPDAVRDQLAAHGGEAFADSALSTWASFVSAPERITSTVQEVLGTPARTFQDWASDHADDFR
jgi:uncharacterized protein YbjT (DUF2867 family)